MVGSSESVYRFRLIGEAKRGYSRTNEGWVKYLGGGLGDNGSSGVGVGMGCGRSCRSLPERAILRNRRSSRDTAYE